MIHTPKTTPPPRRRGPPGGLLRLLSPVLPVGGSFMRKNRAHVPLSYRWTAPYHARDKYKYKCTSSAKSADSGTAGRERGASADAVHVAPRRIGGHGRVGRGQPYRAG
eukprot:6225284-Prymnesium_polylepis.1